MALNKSILLESGLEVTDAYHRIETYNGDKKELKFTLVSYLDKTAATEGKAALREETFSCPPNLADYSYNFIKQGYQYLKTLDQFKDAIDVLEVGQNTN
ncbi:hypothetical protein NST66_29010 [Priestia sp. FSL W8-0524]|uniref:hypothetical protein n=1 Tax=Priestia sp. FSL W8-0524 TaxID=2954625 RepID=UPI0030F67081